MGLGARDTTGRVLAAMGHLSEAQPRFAEPLSAVSGGGVLAGLPMLLQEGLLDRARGFLSLPKGYFGLATVLLFLAFLVLARVRNPEALRHQPPGEWGAILGLDRCPEVKTLRRKITDAGPGRAGRCGTGRRRWRRDGWRNIRSCARPYRWMATSRCIPAARAGCRSTLWRARSSACRPPRATGSTRLAAGPSCA